MISLILVLAMLGILLLLAEIVVPGGVVGVLGLLCLGVAVVLSLTSQEVADAGGWVPPTMVGGVVIATLLGIFGFMRLMRTRAMAHRMSLQSSIRRPEAPNSLLIGSHGKTIGELRPLGRVEINGRKMAARSEHGNIPADSEVEVVRIEFGEPVVRRVETTAQ